MSEIERTTSRRVISSRLGKHFAILIVLFSSCFTLFSTTLQLALDYRADISRIEQQFDNIRTSYLQAITLSVWSIDDSQINTQLVGLSQLPDIEHVIIQVEGETTWEQGSAESTNTRTESFELTYSTPSISSQNIGTLEVTASIDNVYKRLINKAGVILVSNGIKTFLVSGFILMLVWLLITRHMTRISEYLEELDFDRTLIPLQLKKRNSEDKPDEIDYVVGSINKMSNSLARSYQQLKQLIAQRDQLLEEQKHHQEHLEELVSERTEQLENSIKELKSAQNLLVETEKMAALGNMVAGVAHEINTPIGVCRTAASFQTEGGQQIRKKLESGSLTQSDLENFLNDIDESSNLFETNIIKASNLIANFKQIATDQSYDTKHRFNLLSYLQASVQTIYPQFKHQNIKFLLEVDEKIEMDSYPGAFHQVLSNLIHNSIIHGFKDGANGTITIAANQIGDDVKITYRDDGRGLTTEEARQMFEPFFTTRRGKGGSGLGMSIVHNIITRQLKGKIEVITESSDPGIKLEMTTPLEADEPEIEAS